MPNDLTQPQVENPVCEFDAELRIGARTVGITFEVCGEWMRGFPGSRETPQEPKYLDIHRVYANGHDITDWLQDDSFATWFFDEVYSR